jgi:magnesium transporter
MEVLLYKFDNQEIKLLDNKITPDQWAGKVDWIEIHSSDKERVFEYLEPISIIKENHNYIVNPENHTIPKTDNEFIIQNFIISRKDNIYKGDYISLIISMNMIIYIIPETLSLRFSHSQPKNIQSYFDDYNYFFSFSIISDLFTQNIANLTTARNRLNSMEEMLLNKPEKLRSSTVMNIRNDIRQLADIIEDQYVGLNILFSFLEVEEKKKDMKKLKDLLYGFKEINRIVTRLEEKSESFRTQFMLIHQEESAHKINILTILQAIFIPLTFIAGVYGMNFEHMPELGWQHGYYFVLGIFALLSGILLIFFKRNGWFD